MHLEAGPELPERTRGVGRGRQSVSTHRSVQGRRLQGGL
jgi:hypothetical protein